MGEGLNVVDLSQTVPQIRHHIRTGEWRPGTHTASGAGGESTEFQSWTYMNSVQGRDLEKGGGVN